MPQPMSTPTAAGATAPRMAMTEPTVAPRPACTSGITATWCATQGSEATFFSWVMTCESTSLIGAQSRMGTEGPLIVENGMSVNLLGAGVEGARRRILAEPQLGRPLQH